MTEPIIPPPQRPPPRSYGGKSAQERQAARRLALVDAAVRLFGEHGFASVSIDAICAEAGLTKRYFYEAFPSREALLTAAYESVTREYMQSILAAVAPHLMDARQLVRAGLQESFGFVERNPAKARLILIEAMTVRGQLGEMYGERYDAFVGLLLQFTRPLLSGPSMPDKVMRVMAKSAVGMIIHLCQSWIATDFKQPLEDLVNGTERVFAGMGRELGVKGFN
ncbi:MAG TPA: TetR/AcrR family transcriptional regulator [Limnobacter sp.]|nr:TetR/AcrR family transcriptional regulator [Limnobacter sp.]